MTTLELEKRLRDYLHCRVEYASYSLLGGVFSFSLRRNTSEETCFAFWDVREVRLSDTWVLTSPVITKSPASNIQGERISLSDTNVFVEAGGGRIWEGCSRRPGDLYSELFPESPLRNSISCENCNKTTIHITKYCRYCGKLMPTRKRFLWTRCIATPDTTDEVMQSTLP